MKTRAEPRAKARSYFLKAERFARAARANHAAGDHDPAMSNAVNAVINLVDAVCVHASGTRSSSANHGEAIRLLGGLKDVDPALRDALGKRLSTLLTVKGLAQYEGDLVSAAAAEDALQDMDRAFKATAAFAKKTGWE